MGRESIIEGRHAVDGGQVMDGRWVKNEMDGLEDRAGRYGWVTEGAAMNVSAEIC